jgi:hypothetical protein
LGRALRIGFMLRVGADTRYPQQVKQLLAETVCVGFGVIVGIHRCLATAS